MHEKENTGDLVVSSLTTRLRGLMDAAVVALSGLFGTSRTGGVSEGPARTVPLCYEAIEGWPGMCKLMRNPLGSYAGDIEIPATAWLNNQEARVVKIAEDAFTGMPITSLVLPETLTGIYCSFEGCDRLRRVELPAAHKAFASIDGIVFDKERKKLLLFPPAHGARYSVPEGVTQIGERAFAHCHDLRSVALPDSLVKVCRDAFEGCRLEQVSFEGVRESLEIRPGNQALLDALD